MYPPLPAEKQRPFTLLPRVQECDLSLGPAGLGLVSDGFGNDSNQSMNCWSNTSPFCHTSPSIVIETVTRAVSC